MDDTARTEYPAMLESLQPNQAVQTLNDRVKRINRINVEIADWLQERRRVEEQYVMGLKRLSQFRVPNAQSELGVFTGPWAKIVDSVNSMAKSHHLFSERIGRDVEDPLRNFHSRSDAGHMNTISANLTSMAKTLEESQHAAEKLEKKGGKASTQKVDAASSKLESNKQQWDSQAPYIFESLQALDESRINQLRDYLTQYFTHESDCAQKTQDSSAAALAEVLEISPETEILAFANKAMQGRSRLPPPTRSSTRRSSHAETQNSAARPSTGDNTSEAAMPSSQPTPMESQLSEPPTPSLQEPKPEPAKPESKLRRLGTMLGGRRRQSMLGAPSPQKGGGSSFGRLGGKDRPGVSPRGSSNNLHESSRLGALPEASALPRTPEYGDTVSKPSHEGPNGQAGNDNIMDSPVPTGVNGTREGVTLTDEQPQNLPQTTQPQGAALPSKDAEGFSIPAPMNDPISAAQREAAAGEEADQVFKLSIQNKPIEEEDPEAKQAALSNVASSLRAGPAVRRSGTMRGRRDVRNTMYVPSPTGTEGGDSVIPGLASSPSFPTSLSSRPTAVAALQSETSVTGTSDTQSVRSGNSLGSLALVKHPEMTAPGLNASIVEQVSVSYEGDQLKSAAITGELAFVNNASDENMFKNNETIRINNFPNLDKIGPNRIFVQNVTDHPDQFTLDLSHISKTATAFSYRVFAPEADPLSLGQNAPLLLTPAWRAQGDKLGLVIQYQLNPSSGFGGPMPLKDVVFIASYDGKCAGCQTKPTGTHLKDRHIVYWRLGDVTLTNEPQKLVCRLMGVEGVAPTGGHVEARWAYTLPEGIVAGSGISISRLEENKGKGKEVATEDDPFADEDSAAPSSEKWLDVPMARKLVSGRYEGK